MKEIRKFAKTGACALLCAAALWCVPFAACAEEKLDVTVRVEGVDGNLYYEKLSVSDGDGTVTAADALIFADKQSDSLEIKGADTGYITEVNGTAAGKFGGYDGWYYSVNGEVPSVGVNEYTLKESDSLTLYYGGFPCQIPYTVTDRFESDGIIAFMSNDVEYDENWNAKNVTNPVEGASVTLGGEKYTTDKNGEITVDKTKLSGEVSAQIEKKDTSGAPCVLRFAPDYTVSLGAADANTDNGTDSEQPSDTDTAADTDKSSDSDKASDSDKPADSDKGSDSDKSKGSDSDKSSDTGSKSSSSSSSSGGSTAAVKTSAPAASTAAAAPAEATAATGDGRIYLALTVFGAAALVIVVMLLLSRIKKKDQ